MEIVYQRVAAIDVHKKKQIAVAVPTPGGPGRQRRQQVREYARFYAAFAGGAAVTERSPACRTATIPRDQPDSSKGQGRRRCNASATDHAFSFVVPVSRLGGRADATIRAGRVDVPPSRPPGPDRPSDDHIDVGSILEHPLR